MYREYLQTFHFFSWITFLWGFKLLLLISQPILNGFGSRMAHFESEVVNLQSQLAWRSSIFFPGS